MVELLSDLTNALYQHGAVLSEPARRDLLAALVQAAEQHALRERKRCVEICLQRAATWRDTTRKDGPLAPEARARANEALYLADMLETAGELPELAPDSIIS